MYVSKICIKHKNSTSGIFGITLGSDVGLAGGGLQRECLDGHIIIGATKKVDFLPLRSSSCGVGPCATDRCRGDRALFLPTTGLQLQYDMPTPACHRGGRLTSLDASYAQCFAFWRTSSKTSTSMVFKKTSPKHCIVQKKAQRYVKNIANFSSWARCFGIFQKSPKTLG